MSKAATSVVLFALALPAASRSLRASRHLEKTSSSALSGNGSAFPVQKLIYEMDLMHFTQASASKSQIVQATERLQGLQDDFGVTTIWVMPPFERYADAPYATKDYRAVDSRLGTSDEMKAFVAKAHVLQMEVVLDVTTVGHGCKQIGVGCKQPDPNGCWASEGKRGDPARLSGLGDEAMKVVLPYPVDNPFMDLCVVNWNDIGAVIDYFGSIFAHWAKAYDLDGFRCDTTDTFAAASWTQSGYHPNIFQLEKDKRTVNVDFWAGVMKKANSASQKHLFWLAENGDSDFWSEHYSPGSGGSGTNLFDAIYAADLSQGWGGTYLEDALSKGGAAWGILKGALDAHKKLETAPMKGAVSGSEVHSYGKRYMYYITNHDIWAENGGSNCPQVQYKRGIKSQEGIAAAYLITLFASRGLVSIYNGQEQGTDQTLLFNNADHQYDIDPKNADLVVENAHKCGGQLFIAAGNMFTYGEFNIISESDGFAIVRQLPGVDSGQTQELAFCWSHSAESGTNPCSGFISGGQSVFRLRHLEIYARGFDVQVPAACKAGHT